ncbi:MAG TPA: Mur ligase domain-containing protein [Thermodesulfobacteriota bacterium]|nr:Mur ligase domain-containing protein [Thermodesulfobacteriota bacterium]
MTPHETPTPEVAAYNPYPDVRPAAHLPPGVRRIHVMGVGGTAMGSFAGMLKEAGYEVRGSDQQVYPPMSTQLAAWGIPVAEGYRPENLEPRPDLVIVGNVITRANPEAEALLASGIPFMSFPAAFAQLFLPGKHPVVIAGTHGKTTTAALTAWLLAAAGLDPSFLIGGVARNWESNYRLGGGEAFVIEGDEYDTAFFDKGPKFLHYRPRTAVVTSVEFDHADIYRDLEHVKAAFRAFARLLPPAPEGLVLVGAAFPHALDAVAAGVEAAARERRATPATLLRYAARRDGQPPRDAAGRPVALDWEADAIELAPGGASFDVRLAGRRLGRATLPMAGLHNVENALAAVAVAHRFGVPFEAIRAGLASFRGVKRRQEVRGEAGGVVVVDDFAHHPTAVRVTLEGVRAQYPGRPLWAIFEPRSNTSRRAVHQAEYAAAFDAADEVVIARVYQAERLAEGERLAADRLAAAIAARGRRARYIPAVDDIVRTVAAEAPPGAVVLVMSNGGFGGIHDKLLTALRRREEAGRAEG